MRKMITALLIIFIAYSSNAQLSNSKWKGSLNLQGGSMDVEFIFSNDTLDVINIAENESLETMRYTMTDSVLSCKSFRVEVPVILPLVNIIMPS